MAAKSTSKGRTGQAAPALQQGHAPVLQQGHSVVTPIRQGTAVALSDDLSAELLQDSGKGFEEANRDAFAIPFLTILQDLSPQTKTKMAGYVPGARPGQFFQSVSQELLDQVTLIPCHYSQVFIEWVPRSKGGGFVAAYDPLAGVEKARSAVRDGGKLVLPNGNEIMDTRQHFCMLVRKNGPGEGVLVALKSTGLKVSRRWMSQMKAAVIEVKGRVIEPPMFAWAYTFGTEEEANDQGSWHQWSLLNREQVTNRELYRQARAFGAAMNSGSVKVNYEELQAQPEAGRGPADAPGDLDNDIP